MALVSFSRTSACALIALASSCATTSGTVDASTSSEVRAPMDVAGDLGTIWNYLAATYDANGDGRIVEAEYERKGRTVAGLDRDGDGVLTQTDFARADEGGMASLMAGILAQLTMARYLQDDEDANVVTLEELERSILVYDADGDFAVDAAEFVVLHEERAMELPGAVARLERMAESRDPWDSLVVGVDEDDDGYLTIDEFMAFFEENDEGTGVWDLTEMVAEMAGDRSGRGARASMSGPAEGTLAPDFTIAPLGGGDPVSLSSFRGDQAVALIFGSYT